MVLRGSKIHPPQDVSELKQRIHELEDEIRTIEKEEHETEMDLATMVRHELLQDDPSSAPTQSAISQAQAHINTKLLQSLNALLQRVDALEAEQKEAKNQLTEYNKQYKTTMQQLACGGVAGALARTTVAPIDRIKLIIQTAMGRQEAANTETSIVKTASKIVREGGIKSFWKGNFVNCIRVFPYAAIQFASYERFKHLVSINITERFNREFGFLERLLSGACAGATAATLTYPLDVIRVRQATFNDIKGPIDAVSRIYGESGVHGFFRGWVPTVFSLGPFIACNFATFDYLKATFIKDGNTKNANSLLVLGLGAGAGLFAQSVCYPLDTVRRNMQMPGNNYNGTIDCIAKIASGPKGILGFYRGMIPNAIKIVPNNGIRFLAYTKLTAYLGIPTTKIRKQRKD